MFRKILKFVGGVAFFGALAASAYYLFFVRDGEDLYDLDDETNDDLQDFLDKEAGVRDDHYVTLDLSDKKASDDDRIIGDVKEGSNVVKASSDDSEGVEGFSFTDLT